MKRKQILFILLAVVICIFPFKRKLMRPFTAIVQRVYGLKTIDQRVQEYGTAARKRLAPNFTTIGIAYPPKKIMLAGFKSEKILQVWVAADDDNFKLLKTYPILGASGHLGPKLKEGDGQVPEGLYNVESLNPNSMFHLALRVGYPNKFDIRKAAIDGRKNLGGDIMIHGRTCSIGCLAMGDKAIEEIFILAAETGISNINVILSPVDLRTNKLPDNMPQVPQWTSELYELIKEELKKIPISPS